ncbi:MAG: HIT domain-containing protein [Candidatus Eremiobacteraeota bacterium]|nr:HIT domain-containing protein [Candidatus Eremiobacteraeota bacterium]MBC5828267.1 HIT domain-containing protein [Candidatus Eremiobacteraeota bacterium]
MAEDCVFCDIVAGKIPTEYLYEDDTVLAFADLRPIAPHHVLIIPKAHRDTLVHAATEKDGELLLGRLLKVAAQLGGARLETDGGYRIVVNNGPAAGQTVYHLHVHLLSGRHFGWPPG